MFPSHDQWGVQPVARIGRETFYDVRSVLDNRLAHADQRDNAGGTDLVPGTIDYENYRRTKAQADSFEIKNDQILRKLIPADLFSVALSKISAEIGGIIDTLPLQIKRKHPDLNTTIIESIKWQCVKAQNSMARLDSVVVEVIDEYVSELESG